MEVDLNKSLEDKNIIERHTKTNEDGKNQFYIVPALLETDTTIKDLKTRVEGLEDAMRFFSEWYNTTQRANILLPNTLDESGNTKLILPNG